jgi:uncharacterized protein YpmB
MKTDKDRYVWVQDKSGKVFVCKLSDLLDPADLSDEEKAKCLDTYDFDISGAV